MLRTLHLWGKRFRWNEPRLPVLEQRLAQFRRDVEEQSRKSVMTVRAAPHSTVKTYARGRVVAGIREGARSGVQVRLTYIKRNGSVVTRYVSPYSQRGHLFYGKDEHTKSFVTAGIQDVTVTARPAVPDYPVELAK